MVMRQREGIAKAEADGRYTGQKPTEIANRVGIGRAGVYRILREQMAA